MSLRLRLNLLLTAIFLLTVLVGSTYLLTTVRETVQEELESSVELASRLIALSLSGIESKNASIETRRIQKVLDEKGQTRHLYITIYTEAGTLAVLQQSSRKIEPDAPRWFVDWVQPEPFAVQRTLHVAATMNRIVVRANPSDEISEAWRESKLMFFLLMICCIMANSLIYFIIGRALKPLASISEGLQDIEKGNLSFRLPHLGLPEIDIIAARFNDMAISLEESRETNRAMAQRSLAIQEDERHALAQELHDEMGQSISAIKALAVSITERVSDASDPIRTSALTIAEVSSEVYARVRNMMMHLRPIILDELGLVAALGKLIDDWNNHHEHTFCAFEPKGNFADLSPEVNINLYRVVQEALTNVAKHAQASAVSVILTREPGDGFDGLSLVIADNGQGYDALETRRGLGLVGMQERIASVGGELNVETAIGAGTTIGIDITIGRQ